MNCIKCGTPLASGLKFCMKCGQPIDDISSSKSNNGISKPGMPKPTMPGSGKLNTGMPKPGMPKPTMPGSGKSDTGMPKPGMPKPTMPGSGKSDTGMPKPGMPKPNMPKPTMPGPGAPQPPSAIQPVKGAFTNAVRSVANVMTGGALNRDIARQQEQALLQQARESQTQLQEVRQAQETAERARERAEREAERAADRRSMELVDGIEVVRGRAIWNIQPGEIARRIKESELEEVEKLKGIIVQEGCSALIYANGEQVAALSAGAYLFYKSVEEEQAALRAAVNAAEKEMAEAERKRLEERRRAQPTFQELGIVGELGRAVGWVGRIIFGQKKKDDKVRKRQLDYARLLSRLTQPPILAVYIVSDRQVPLTFGGKSSSEGSIDFTPYTIPMGIHNVEVGVSLEVCVCDVRQLAINYLSDKTRLTTSEIYNILSPTIENLLRTNLRNLDYASTGLPVDLTDRLKDEISQLVDQRLHGIRCTAVYSITDNNADFERFRSVERQLYNTEREIDFMERTGEFRNRLEIEANSQQLESARNAEDIRHKLNLLNNDRLLHDNEIEEFVELLESQRRIRQATTAEEELTAFDELKKNRLVKQDEIEALQDALIHKKIPREEITQIMRIQSQQKVEEASVRAEWAIGDLRSDHDWERQDLERRRNWGIEDESREREWAAEQREYDRAIGRRRSEDEYDFQQMMRRRELELADRREERAHRIEDENREFDHRRIEREDEDRLEGNRHQRNIDKLQAMAQMQAQIDAQKYQHEENVATIGANERMNRDNNFANMTADQIRAAQISHLSADAQVAMANAYGSEKEMETLRAAASDKEAMMQQMLRMQQDSTTTQMNAMMQMAGMIKDTATGISGAMQGVQQRQIDSLENQRAHEQSRNEHLQDRAIDNLSMVSNAAASNINAFNGGGKASMQPQLGQHQAVPESSATEMIECQCYNCGHTIRIAYGAQSCPDCGAPFQWS